MPYIKSELRKKYDKALNQIIEIDNKGDLEYCVFKLMKTFMHTREKRYSTLHEVVYAVIHCGDEFRRRYLDKREDDARETNGDVE
jgi:predicted MarR family transcription regulator